MIRLLQVGKSYGPLQALNAVDLQIDAGECVVLIGPSGCGKSTLLKSINRMVTIDTGHIKVEGKDVNDYQPELLRRQIGYCIQGVGLFPHLSVKDNIAVVPRLLRWPEKDIDDRIALLMSMSELSSKYLHKKPHELSGGESQRVGVCRALAANPPILLMDEPFGAVDPLTREKLQAAFGRIQSELRKTVLFVTHDVEEAIILGDRIAVMNQGEVLECKTPAAFSAGAVDPFSKAFLGGEYPLRLLKRFTFTDLTRVLPRPAAEPALKEEGAGTRLDAVMKIEDDTTLKEILSELMRRNIGMMILETPGGAKAAVSYADIVGFLHKVSNP